MECFRLRTGCTLGLNAAILFFLTRLQVSSMGLSLQGIARQRRAKTTSKFRERKDEMSVAEIVSDLKAERIRIEKAI